MKSYLFALVITPLLGSLSLAGHNHQYQLQQTPVVAYQQAPTVAYALAPAQTTAVTTQALVGPTSGPLHDVENNRKGLLARLRTNRETRKATKSFRRGETDAVTVRDTDLVQQQVVAQQVCVQPVCQPQVQMRQVPVTTYERRVTRVPVTTYEERTVKVPVTTYEEQVEEVPVTTYRLEQDCCVPEAPVIEHQKSTLGISE